MPGARAALLGAILFAHGGCGGNNTAPHVETLPDPPASDASRPLLLRDVTVVPMTGDAPREHRAVLVRDGRIAEIGEAAAVRAPEGAVVIEGRGRWLMPALIDMHVHLRDADVPAYLAAGVGTVRNMWGHPNVARLRDEIAAGRLAGPAVVSASSGLDGDPPSWPYTQRVLEPSQAAPTVAAQAEQGWAYIKVYQQLSLASYDAIVAAARARGLPVIGHVPTAVTIQHALASGQRSIEHFSGYDRAVSATGRRGTFGWSDAERGRFPALVEATVAAGAWNCPTMAINVALSSRLPDADRVVRHRREFLRALAEAGAPLLLGSDAGIDVVPAGASLHDELAEFVAAGLPPESALRAGTADAARFLGREDLGVVRVGAQADLLLLPENPLEDVGNVRTFDGMVLRGAWRPAGGS